MSQEKEVKTRKISKFAIAIIVICSLILIVGGGALIYLWNYLAAYEETIPTAPIDDFLHLLDKGSYSEAMAVGKIEPDYFGGTDSFAKYVDEAFDSGKSYAKASYRKASAENEDGSVVYSVYNGENRVCKVTVKKTDEMNSFDMNYYRVVAVEFTALENITVTVPNEAVLTVNGKIVDKSNGEEKTVTEYFGGIDQAKCPKIRSYVLSGYVLYPEIAVTDADGVVCTSLEGNEYDLRFVRSIDQSATDEYTELTTIASKSYAGYVTCNVSKYTLLGHILKGTTFYKEMQEYENKWYGYNRMSYENVKVFNINEFDGEHFTAEITMTQKVSRATGKVSYDLHYIAAFINSNGKWYMTYLTTVSENNESVQSDVESAS